MERISKNFSPSGFTAKGFATCVCIGAFGEQWLKQLGVAASRKAEVNALKDEVERLSLLHKESIAKADKAVEDADNLGKRAEELGEKNKDLEVKLELAEVACSEVKKSAKGEVLQLALGVHKGALSQVHLFYPEVDLSIVHPLNVVENGRLVKYFKSDPGET